MPLAEFEQLLLLYVAISMIVEHDDGDVLCEPAERLKVAESHAERTVADEAEDTLVRLRH